MPVVLDRYNCWQWMEDRPVSELNQLMSPVEAAFFDIECLDQQKSLF